MHQRKVRHWSSATSTDRGERLLPTDRLGAYGKHMATDGSVDSGSESDASAQELLWLLFG